MYVVAAIRRRGATQEVLPVEPTVNIPGRRAFGVSTSGNEPALASRYMLEHWESTTGCWRGRIASRNQPEYVLEMVCLVREKVVDSGPQRQRCVRGPDDRFRDVEVYTFKGCGSKPGHTRYYMNGLT